MPRVTKKRSRPRLPKTCCICLMDIDSNEEARITSCRHRYHHRCIKKWSCKENSCPQCRKRFNWIVHMNTKRKEAVRRRHQTDPLPYLSRLVQTFFTDNHFRRVMTLGIYERSPGALDILRVLCGIIHAIRTRNLILTIVDEETRTEAYAWLDTMEIMDAAYLLTSPDGVTV